MFLVNNNIFLMKDYSEDDFARLAKITEQGESKTIVISREIALNAAVIDKICRYFKGGDIRVSIPIANTTSSTIFNEQESMVLQSNFAKLKENHFSALFVEGNDVNSYTGYTLEETVVASRKISEWANSINSATVYGRPLSPLEKFLFAYNLVTEFSYSQGSEDNVDSRMDSRNLVKILTGDKIVCVGYASMLAELCKQINIPCLVQFAIDSTGESFAASAVNHANCKVYIEDPYYGYYGMINADPSKDAMQDQFGQTICHAAIIDRDMDAIFGGKLRLAGEHWFYPEAINAFMNQICGNTDESVIDQINMQSLYAEIEKILISVFTSNYSIMEDFRNHGKETRLDFDELEKTYFSSIYDELYRVALNPHNKYTARRLEKLLVKTYERSALEIDDLFAEIIDYGNRYLPEGEMLEEFISAIDETNANRNYIEMKEFSSQSENIDPKILFEAMCSVLYARGSTDEMAIKKTSLIFENSTRLARAKWSFEKKSENYFQDEAAKLRKVAPKREEPKQEKKEERLAMIAD